MDFLSQFRQVTHAVGAASLLAWAAVTLGCSSDDADTPSTAQSSSVTSSSTGSSGGSGGGGDSGGQGGQGGHGGESSEAPYRLTVEGSGYAAFESKMVSALLLEAGVIVKTAETTVQSGAFTIVWEDAVEPDSNYRVAFFTDDNSDGFCTVPPDGAWQIDVPAVTGDTSVQAPYDEQSAPEVCAFFEAPPPGGTFSLLGDGFDAEEGKIMRGAARMGATVVVTAQGTITGGSFTLDFAEMPVGIYVVDYFADMDADGACSGADHAWSLPGVPIESRSAGGAFIMSSTNYDPSACGSFQ